MIYHRCVTLMNKSTSQKTNDNDNKNKNFNSEQELQKIFNSFKVNQFTYQNTPISLVKYKNYKTENFEIPSFEKYLKQMEKQKKEDRLQFRGIEIDQELKRRVEEGIWLLWLLF